MNQIGKLFEEKQLQNFTDEELAILAREDMKVSLQDLRTAWYNFLYEVGGLYNSQNTIECFNTKTDPFGVSVDEVPIEDWIDEVLENIEVLEAQDGTGVKALIQSKLAAIGGKVSDDN